MFARTLKSERQSGDKHADCCLVSFQLTPEAEEKVRKSREVIDAFIREDKGMLFLHIFFNARTETYKAHFTCFSSCVLFFTAVVYGVNTGFGKFAHTLISKEQLG